MAEPYCPEPPPVEDHRSVPGFCAIHGRATPCARCALAKLRSGECARCGWDLDEDWFCNMCGALWPKP